MHSTSEVTGAAGRPTTDPRPRRAFDGAAAGPFTELSARRLGPVRRFFLRRPVVMDAVVMLWFGVPAILEAVLSENGTRREGLVVFAVAGTGVLVWRRRRPLLVAVGMTALGAGQTAAAGSLSGYDLGIALAVYAVAASRAPRDAWVTAVTSGGVLSVAALLWERPTPQGATASVWTGNDAPHETVVDLRIASITGVVLLVLVAISIGISVRNRRVHVADLVDRGNQLARQHDQQAQLAVAAERARIAREMHDVVAHSLT
ncbi:MAG TPA: histidine kinase, partial [Cellulomonadaceae bacterium]|nr:histidine kinase [Cellulomonadaceae bacterium]